MFCEQIRNGISFAFCIAMIYNKILIPFLFCELIWNEIAFAFGITMIYNKILISFFVLTDLQQNSDSFFVAWSDSKWNFPCFCYCQNRRNSHETANRFVFFRNSAKNLTKNGNHKISGGKDLWESAVPRWIRVLSQSLMPHKIIELWQIAVFC
jgi:hypothetical protein